jgi:hypothetical protein
MKETGKASRSGQQAEEEMEGPRGRSGGGMASRAKKTAGTRAGAGRQSLRQSGTSGARGSGRSSGNVMTDHEEIRQWAEERGAKPACVRGTGGKSDTGLIRLDFPGYSGGDSLEEISWDEWFAKFDEQNLALLYQDKTARGQKSNFNKLVSRETAASGQTRKARR